MLRGGREPRDDQFARRRKHAYAPAGPARSAGSGTTGAKGMPPKVTNHRTPGAGHPPALYLELTFFDALHEHPPLVVSENKFAIARLLGVTNGDMAILHGHRHTRRRNPPDTS